MLKSFTLFIICIFSLSAVIAQNTYNEVTLPELLKKLEQKEPNMIIVDVSKSPGQNTGIWNSSQVTIYCMQESGEHYYLTAHFLINNQFQSIFKKYFL